MAGQDQDGIWPLPKFYFRVEISDVGEISCQEVAGLDIEAQPIEYRAGDSKIFSPIKMPGLLKTGNVTVKKGFFVNDDRFWSWYEQIKLNTVKRQTVTITVLDQDASPAMVWKLTNAWPTKIVVNDLDSDDNVVAVELIEFGHEGMAIAN